VLSDDLLVRNYANYQPGLSAGVALIGVLPGIVANTYRTLLAGVALIEVQPENCYDVILGYIVVLPLSISLSLL